EHLADAGMPVVLAVAMMPGLNDNQVGPTMDVIARSRANIVAVNFQCATPFGGRFDIDAPRKLRLPDMFELMRQQCGLEPSGFFPVGSGSPLCNAYGRVAFIDGQWRHALKDLTVDDFMDLMGDDPVDFVRALTVGLSESVPYMAKQVMKNPRLLKKVVPLVGNDPLGWNWVSDRLLDSGEGSSFYVPLISDPRVSGSWFVGLQHVWRTKDNGGSQAFLEKYCNEFTGDYGNRPEPCGDWEALGGPAGAGEAGDLVSPLYGADKGGSYVVAVERTRSDKNTLWAATRRGRLFVSKNADAANAADVTFTRLDSASTPTRFVSGIVIDRNDANHAWVSFSGYDAYAAAAGTATGHVFEVTYNPGSGTATWKDISANIGDQPITDITLDHNTGDLYAGTDFGVL
ncbi:hypothetical protein SE17_34300, partial [Kouleothrix aurantiaca]